VSDPTKTSHAEDKDSAFEMVRRALERELKSCVSSIFDSDG